MQIFASRFVLALKVVVLDAELNSASNDDIFKGEHRAKNEVLAKISGFLPYFCGIPCGYSLLDLCWL